MSRMSLAERLKTAGMLARAAEPQTGIGLELYEDVGSAGTYCVDAAGVRVAESGTLAHAEGVYDFLAAQPPAVLMAVIDHARETG